MTENLTMLLVDSHAHLEGERYDADRDQVLSRARETGVQTIVAIGSGTGPGSLDCGIILAEQHDFIYATIGIHPHEAKLAADSDFTELEQLSKRPKVIAVGEIGLDYFYDHSPREVQQQVFVKQMELARAAKLPIVIHNRPSQDSENAWDDFFALINHHWASSGLGGILHCFTGTWAHVPVKQWRIPPNPLDAQCWPINAKKSSQAFSLSCDGRLWMTIGSFAARANSICFTKT